MEHTNECVVYILLIDPTVLMIDTSLGNATTCGMT